MNITECLRCGKDFKFPAHLLRHLQRKNPCNENDLKNIQNRLIDPQNRLKNIQNDLVYICPDGCGKEFRQRDSLLRHKYVCRKVPNTVCSTCKKQFSSCKTRCHHERTVECERVLSIEERLVDMEEKLRLAETRISTENPQTINNTQNITYNITYEKGSMICDRPGLEQNEMLCIEGFKRESYYGKVNIDMGILKVVTMGVIDDGDYDKFFKFMFRDDTNRRLHFMSLGKNVGATHCDTFERGKLEKIEKGDLFNRVMGYLACWLVGIDSRYIVMSNLLFTKKSKVCFFNTMREPSEHFQYFLENV